MNTVLKAKPNRFKKILDDAGRPLEKTGDYRCLENLPKANDEGKKAYVPFPYGPQPGHKTGWK